MSTLKWKVIKRNERHIIQSESLSAEKLPTGAIEMSMPDDQYDALGEKKAYAMLTQWAKILNDEETKK